MRALLLLLATAGPALAWSDTDRITFAGSLGSVLASEEMCGLTFNQQAITDLVAAKVPADDMEFPSTLNMMVSGAEFTNKRMSASQKTAHCAQISRVAKQYGLTS